MDNEYRIASLKTLTAEQADKLSQSLCDRTRRRLASNPGCPAAVLRRLAFDRNVEVRASVALNPSTEAIVLDKLCLDGALIVRFYLAGNHNLGASRLRLLMSDKNPYIAERASGTNEIRLLEEQLAKHRFTKTEKKPLLGHLLVDADLITNNQLQESLAQASRDSRTLGNVLVEKRILHRSKVAQALVIQNQIALGNLTFREGVYTLGVEARIEKFERFQTEHHFEEVCDLNAWFGSHQAS